MGTFYLVLMGAAAVACLFLAPPLAPFAIGAWLIMFGLHVVVEKSNEAMAAEIQAGDTNAGCLWLLLTFAFVGGVVLVALMVLFMARGGN